MWACHLTIQQIRESPNLPIGDASSEPRAAHCGCATTRKYGFSVFQP
jgi:hypothetical protein